MNGYVNVYARSAPGTHHRRRTVADGSGGHRGLPEPLGPRWDGSGRPRAGRTGTTCPLGQDRTVATVGAAGFLAPGESHAAGKEREALATRWEGIHAADRHRDDDLSFERSLVPSPEPPWPDEPDLDRDPDYGLGL